jgi:uncharacterized protein involved in cysteine biosynthesis
VQAILRAIGQLDDPDFQGVLARSLVYTVLAFAALLGVAIWAVHGAFTLHGWIAWLADAASGVLAALLAFWLFLPVAGLIATLFFERVARAVERRHYPWLPPAHGAPITMQVWDGLTLAARILVLNIVALALALALPGVGLVLGWAVAAYAIGRGLFVAVAMRRMDRGPAESLYRDNRTSVLVAGALLALAGYVPVLNLLVPVIGVAAMVHLLDATLRPAARLP